MSLSYKQIRGTIRCESGVRVGAGRDELTIGGVDLPVVRDVSTNEPFIPGSSIKGRMRALIELDQGLVQGKEPHGCVNPNCLFCRVFGPHKQPKHSFGPTRLMVRDAYLVEDYAQKFKNGEPVLETRTESTNDRTNTTAYNPRPVERIARGVELRLKLTLRILPGDDENKVRELVKEGLRFLQDDGIGGGLSRGHGEVTITITEPAEWNLS